MLVVALLAGCGLQAIAASFARAEEQTWQTILRQQLRSERGCVLKHIVFVKSFPLGNRQALEGRVRCIDGREFDFTREKAHHHFRLQLCRPSVC